MKSVPAFICLLLLLSSAFPQSGITQKKIRLSSPDGRLDFGFRLTGSSPEYTVSFRGKTLIESSGLGLSFQDAPDFTSGLRSERPVFREGEDDYELITGKACKVNDRYREVRIPLRETRSPFRLIVVVVRLFNDGLAFRYEYPLQKEWSSYTLTEENTCFRLAGDPVVHALFLPNFTTSHEGVYSTLPWSTVKQDTLMDMPALFEWQATAGRAGDPGPGDPVYLAITEAALLDYAGMYLVKHKDRLLSRLSPLPGQSSVKVKAKVPHQSPWRVMLISDRIGALIESNILTDLNTPCTLGDMSWLKPGKTSFPWWNGNIVPDTLNAPGNNFETAKYYIDFCARNRLEYHSVVEYGLHEWYVNDGANFMPGPHADPTRAVPGLDMQAVCDYAREKGVGIRVWVHWAALYPKLEQAFTQFEKWGIKGMMVDFMDRDDQEMVNIQTEILQRAAAHHLHIQFHGAYKPTGLSRTYPNELTREGTLNYETNKWGWGADPDHDINFPFTRMLAGPMDYHLGGFRAVPDSAYHIQYSRPLMHGTRCHMLAMYVVLESYLGMVCDYPAAYEGQPGFEFLQEVPTVWDETRVLDARVGEYIVIARRKNKDWFIGAITNHLPRQLTLPLNFLEPGNYRADSYGDAPDTDKEPNHLIKLERSLHPSDTVMLALASGGGAALRIRSF